MTSYKFYTYSGYMLKLKELKYTKPKNRLHNWWLKYRIKAIQRKLNQSEVLLTEKLFHMVNKRIQQKKELLKSLDNSFKITCVEIDNKEDIQDAIFCR